MQAVLNGGQTVEIGGFKSISDGIVLTEDEDRDTVIGFVPHDRIAVIVPDEAAESWDLEKLTSGARREESEAAGKTASQGKHRSEARRPPQNPTPPTQPRQQSPPQQVPPGQPPAQFPPYRPPWDVPSRQQPPQQQPPQR